jgi:hypothetical protein
MGRRCVLGAVGLALALAGCGTMKLAAKGEPVWLRHRLDWTVYQPSHRVALAAYEVLKEELGEVKVANEELSQEDRFNVDGKTPNPGEVKIPDDYPAFWMDSFDPAEKPLLVNCRYVDLEAKTKDDKSVEVIIRLEIVGKTEQHTVVSVQVGHKGDEKLTKGLIDKISGRVQEPKSPPGSAEERAELTAAFGYGTQDNWDMDATTGEIRRRSK